MVAWSRVLRWRRVGAASVCMTGGINIPVEVVQRTARSRLFPSHSDEGREN